MRREGGRRIGLCSRIRLSAPVVRSPAPPSRDTPRPPTYLDLPGFYTRLHHRLLEGGGEGGRGKEGGGNRTIDRSTHFRSKPCRFRKFAAFRGDVGGLGLGWTCGKRVERRGTGRRKRARSRSRVSEDGFFYADFWKFSFSTVEILKKILLELKISRGKIRGRKYKNRKMVDGREFGEMGRIGPPPPREPTYYGNKYRSGRSAVVLIAVVNPPRAGGTDKPGPFPRSRGNILLRAPSPLNIANA